MSAPPGSVKHSRIWQRLFGSWLACTVTGLVIVFSALAAPSIYYERSGKACSSCHEISHAYNNWHSSTHRDVPCSSCHGDVFTLNTGFHIRNMSRVLKHLRGDIAEKPHLKSADVLAMLPRCQSCHQQEFAAWRSSRHSTSYSDIFLNTTQNQKQKLTDDCLRCHAMYFQGGIRDLITPVNREGPWRLKYPELAQQPAIPCLACHQVHREGLPLLKSEPTFAKAPPQEIARPSLAFFDRREFEDVAVTDLSLPAMFDGSHAVMMSPDQRQALCYQCHAPTATRMVFSGDDRTPTGVHEGLSCFSCHLQHGEQTLASCNNCHSQHQDCKLNVGNMDTTFKDKASSHNIHNVKCIDCHTKGIPKRPTPPDATSVF